MSSGDSGGLVLTQQTPHPLSSLQTPHFHCFKGCMFKMYSLLVQCSYCCLCYKIPSDNLIEHESTWALGFGSSGPSWCVGQGGMEAERPKAERIGGGNRKQSGKTHPQGHSPAGYSPTFPNPPRPEQYKIHLYYRTNSHILYTRFPYLQGSVLLKLIYTGCLKWICKYY